MVNFAYPRIFEKSKQFKVFANGQQVEVIHSCVADICIIISDEKIDLQIDYCDEINEKATSLNPTSAGKKFSVKGKSLFCDGMPDEKFVAFVNDRLSMCPLFVAIYPTEEKPDMNDENVLFFKSGQVYETGLIELTSNQTLYIEEGAIVRGAIRVMDADNIKICGRGVLDNSYYDVDVEKQKSIILDKCTNCEIHDISIINSTRWMVQVGWCENILIDGIIESGQIVSTDGIDIVSSSKVKVVNCLLSNNDDCVVLKAFDTRHIWSEIDYSLPVKDVEDILVEKCIFLNGPSGNAIEIGHELHSKYIKNVVFRDIDILTSHDIGSAISIHNCDDAIVTDILFENIRIEHYYDKLFDIRVMRSQFSHKAPGKGFIRNIKFKDIKVKFDPCNIGYSISQVSGFDKEHITEDVVFEDIYLNDEVIVDPELIEMCFRNVKNIQFIDTKNNRKRVIDFNI